MRQQTRPSKEPAEKVVQDIRRATRKHYSAEEKIRIVLEGLRGEDSIAELCRSWRSSGSSSNPHLPVRRVLERIGIPRSTFYRWCDLYQTGGPEDVTDTLELALQTSGLDQINVAHRPRLLSDNGPSYVSVELAAWLDKQHQTHIRGAPYHPMTQGKIERWPLTLKNRILLENYYL